MNDLAANRLASPARVESANLAGCDPGGRLISPAVFWHTFRPTFNDQLESLLLPPWLLSPWPGASALWHQLVADGGRIKDTDWLFGLGAGRSGQPVRHRPLLCFDELDLRP